MAFNFPTQPSSPPTFSFVDRGIFHGPLLELEDKYGPCLHLLTFGVRSSIISLLWAEEGVRFINPLQELWKTHLLDHLPRDKKERIKTAIALTESISQGYY